MDGSKVGEKAKEITEKQRSPSWDGRDHRRWLMLLRTKGGFCSYQNES